jgi:hypothetical protein
MYSQGCARSFQAVIPAFLLHDMQKVHTHDKDPLAVAIKQLLDFTISNQLEELI